MALRPYYFSVLIDKAWANRFKAIAYRKGLSASEIIRRLVESYIEQEERTLTAYGQRSKQDGEKE
jgi:metal-responsive CopG/Arc/MetJ family transcriptional regulator